MGQIRISDAEWLIMKTLWNSENGKPMALGEVVRSLSEDTRWSYTTIRTLLIRLVEKKAVRADKGTGVYRYSPLLSEEEAALDEASAFLDRVFDNEPSRLFSLLLRNGKVDETERQMILRLLSDPGDSETK